MKKKNRGNTSDPYNKSIKCYGVDRVRICARGHFVIGKKSANKHNRYTAADLHSVYIGKSCKRIRSSGFARVYVCTKKRLIGIKERVCEN